MFFGIVDRYVGRNVLSIMCISLLVLSLITLLITFIDMMRHLGKGDIDIMFLLGYALMLLPSRLVYLFPVSLLLGGVIGLGLLSKNSELVILESCGMSRSRIILSSFKTVLPVILLFTVLAQSTFPQIRQYAENRFNYYSSEGRVSRTSWGIWVREGDSFLSIKRVMSDSSIHEITRYDFDDMRLKAVSVAESGIYNDGKWDMFNIRQVNFNEDRLDVRELKHEKWELYLNPERIDIFNFNTEELSVPALMDYIGYLEDNNIDSGRYRCMLYKILLSPLSMMLMLLLGASTVFGSMRSVHMSFRVLTGLMLGFGFYICNEVLPNFMVAAGFYPVAGATLPLLVFAGVSVLLLRRRL